MNNEEILNGNKLIAEFMGEEVTQDGKWKSKHNGVMEFCYHTSWDWLKPVINEIGKYKLAHPVESDKVSQMKIIAEILPAWGKVVEFITWYNQQTTT